MDSNINSQKDGEEQRIIGFDNATDAPSKDYEIHQPLIQCENLGNDDKGYFCIIAAIEDFGRACCPHTEKPFIFTNNGGDGTCSADFVFGGKYGGDGVCWDFELKKAKIGFEKRERG